MAHTYGTSARLPATATTTNANPATVALTCGAGTTVLWLGIVVGGTTQRTGGAPTYNGVTMTQIGSKLNAGGTPETYTEHWYLLDPPTGSSYNISVPNSNTRNLALIAATGLAGSGKWSLLDVNSTATGSSTNPTASITSTRNGDIIFAICGNGATTWSPTARSGTQIYDWDAGSWGLGAQYVLQASAGAQATNWTFGTSEDWGIQNAAFKLRSGLKDSGTLIGRAAIQTPSIVTSRKKTTAVDTFSAKAIQQIPVYRYEKTVAVSLMQARAQFFGSLVATSTGITEMQNLPQYAKASQKTPTISALLHPKVSVGLQQATASQKTPTISVQYNYHPVVQVGLLQAHAVQHGQHTSTSNGITMQENIPLYGKASQKTPTISAVINAEVVNVTVAASHLYGVAVEYGTVSATVKKITLEQRHPLAGTGHWPQHDIGVNTEYSSPIDVSVITPIAARAELFGNHTSSDLIMSPEEPHQAVANQFEPTVTTYWNPSPQVDKLIARADIKAPVFQFEVNVIVAAGKLTATDAQKSPTILKVGSVSVQASLLNGVATQKTQTERYEKTIAASLLQAAAIEKTPTIGESEGILADYDQATATLKTPTISVHKQPVVAVNKLTITGSQKTPALVTVYEGAIHPDCLVATGGMRTPAIVQVHIIGLMRMLLAESAPRVDIEGARPYVVVKGEVE